MRGKIKKYIGLYINQMNFLVRMQRNTQELIADKQYIVNHSMKYARYPINLSITEDFLKKNKEWNTFF